MLTGAFHLDGLGDIFDGLVGGWNPKQRLEILKDSRHGTYGVTAIALQLILQISLISSFPGTDGFWVLVLTHCVARAAPIYLMQIPATPGHEGMGATISKEVKSRDVLLATAITLVIGISILKLSFVFMLLVLLFINAIFVRWVKSKIGGLLGDSFGAAEQLSETTILVYLVATFFTTGSLTWNF
jgi:adenosylcobinamide-GDP ribazoletransferase